MKREKEIRKLLGNDYHLSVEMTDGEVMQWVLFRNYNDTTIYFSKDNKPIMRSGQNTEEELYEFAKKHHRPDGDKTKHIIRITCSLAIWILSIVNIYLSIDLINVFNLTSCLWILIWAMVDHRLFEANWKIDMLELEENWQRRKKDLLEKVEEK